MAVQGGSLCGIAGVVVAAIVFISIYGCSAESETSEGDPATQSANRTVAYLSDAQQAVLVEEVQPVLPDVPMDAGRVSEAMRSTCVAMLDEVPNIDRVAASYLTAGLQADLSELSPRSWCSAVAEFITWVDIDAATA